MKVRSATGPNWYNYHFLTPATAVIRVAGSPDNAQDGTLP